MEKEYNAQSHYSIGYFGIFRDTFKTIGKNVQHLGPILVIMFLYDKNIVAPLDEYLVMQLAKNPYTFFDLSYNSDQPVYPDALDDILEILSVKLMFLAFSVIIELVLFIAVVSSSYEAYTANLLEPKDVLLKIKTSWIKTLVTSFYMFLITLGITCLAFISFSIASFSAANSWSRLYFGAITMLILISYLYIAALWNLSMVVSVLEEGFDGVKAIGRATELMSGKKLQASVIMVPFAITYFVLVSMDDLIMMSDLSWSSALARSIAFTHVSDSWLKLLLFVMFTVFYHEQKTSHDDKVLKGLYFPSSASKV
ncbi:hypothetical protein Tco_0702582 [Tanacetum coccineum]|uniref:Uncharacterized protein n=1 Tax=Tanacetum coccineum TaxID=301880 RepID=A0ABQ4XX94_9ASTR